MSQIKFTRARLSAVGLGRAYGVIDIGSNSIRLVIYEAITRAPATLFNERVQCGLGAGIEIAHRLNPEAIEPSLGCLERFACTAEELGAPTLDVVATAAIREAEDGEAFVREAKRRTGLDIRVISGHEEARLSALGAASAAPGLTGLVGDLGGASLELVEVTDGKPGRSSTLSVGPLRFKDGEGKAEKFAAAFDREFALADWLASARGRPIHLVGGTWRALARLHMAHTNYPLPIIHAHHLSRQEAESLTRLVAGLSPKTMRKVMSVPKRRQESLPFGALALGRMITRIMPSDVVFSAYGLREGLLYDRLSPSERLVDPLLAGCAELSGRLGRGSAYGEALDRWLNEAIRIDVPRDAILRRAACDLADVCWRDHPDYRAEHAFHQVLRAPFVGLDHAERAFLAVAAAMRYRAGPEVLATQVVETLLTQADQRRACALGLAMRLAALVSNGRPELLEQTQFVRGEGAGLELILREAPESAMRKRLEKMVGEIAALLDFKASSAQGAVHVHGHARGDRPVS